MIGSQFFYIRKLDGSAKVRIVPWVHRDRDKDFLRFDTPSVRFEAFRLLLSIGAEKAWEIFQMDVKVAYLQSKGFNREVYFRPPREENTYVELWKLEAASYGRVDSGRL